MKSEMRLEKTLKSLMKHLEDGDAVLIISGCRNGNSCDINYDDTNDIRINALKNEFTYHRVKVDGKEDENNRVYEEFTIIYAPKEWEDELYSYGKRWGAHCEQESIFFIHSNGSSELLYTKDCEDAAGEKHKQFESVMMDQFQPQQLDCYLVQIRGKRFSLLDLLVNEEFYIMPKEYTEADVLPSTRMAYNWHNRKKHDPV